MYTLNKIILASLALAFLSGQSLTNGFGPGKIYRTNNATMLGNATTGIVPGFRQGVSLNNPSTWSNLNFTIISTGYGLWEAKYGSPDVLAGNSELTMVKLVVPFKSMLSFGIEFKPYSSQTLDITSAGHISGGTSSTTRVVGGGGLSTVNLSLGGIIGNYEAFGIELGYIYGSNRNEYSLSFDDRTFAKVDKYVYSGMLFNLYGNTERFKIKNKSLGIYLKSRFALKPISAEITSLAPYEDANESGFYDQSFPTLDYPNPSWLSESKTIQLPSIHSPFLFGIGLEYNIGPNISLATEGVLTFENGNNPDQVSIFKDYIDRKSQFSLSLFGYGDKNGRSFRDKLYLRTGLFIENNLLKFSGDSFTEKGLNLGLGIKFGSFNNQIDIGYSIGMRNEFGDMPEEIIQNVSLTLSLGDLWFVKRRER